MQLALTHREKTVTTKSGRYPSLAPLTSSVTEVKKYATYEEAGGEAKIKEILEKSFNKKVVSDFFESKPIAIFVAKEDGKTIGIAIIKAIEVDGTVFPYLDKIAVIPEAAGKGVGSKIWAQMKEDFKALCWRATLENPANEWYTKEAQAKITTDKWMIYGIGIESNSFESVSTAINLLKPSLT